MTAAKGINDALFNAIAAMGPLTKDSTNPHFKNKYASLSAVLDVIEGPLNANNLTVIQPIDMMDLRPVLKTVLTHTPSGETLEWACPIMCKDPDNPQSFGSAVTYMRRFSLGTLFGLVAEDDDGQHGSQSAPRRAPDAPQQAGDPNKASPAQIGKISAMIKEKYGDRLDDAKSDMFAVTGKNSRADLTKGEASDFIEYLTKGDDNGEDAPF